jgi:type I restriction enzyme M protein
MLSSDIKSRINKLWDKFWSRGLSNPITAIEQISYLLFMKRIDEADSLEKAKAIFEEREFISIFHQNEDCRWSYFSDPNLDPNTRLEIVSKKAFPFIKNLNDPSQPYSRHMQNANFVINNAALLSEAVTAIDEIFESIKPQQYAGQQFQDTQGDVYEHLINQISQAGKNGQFRTPRHLIQFMCELVDLDYTDTICNPACGTGGFLLGAYQHILTKHSSPDETIEDENGFKRFKKNMAVIQS